MSECKSGPQDAGEAYPRAAERLLGSEGLDVVAAIEALETVGYHVERRADGTYAVRAPDDASKGEGGAGGRHPARPDLFADYPEHMTPSHISDIFGLEVCYVRRLMSEGRLPWVTVDKRRVVPKEDLIAMFHGGRLG